MSDADQQRAAGDKEAARLDLPWDWMPELVDVPGGAGQVLMYRVYDDDRRVVAECSSREVAEAIAHWSHRYDYGPFA